MGEAMKLARFGQVLALTVSLSGCAFLTGGLVEELANTTPIGSAFTKRLTAEYLDFALFERNEMFDFFDAEHFARKGLEAARGDAVLPEELAAWRLPEGKRAELAAARARLMLAIDEGARETAPEETAVAQARFDCWIEQQEENFESADIDTCRTAFMEAMALVEERMQPPPPPEPEFDTSAMPELPPAGPPPMENATFLVFFDFDSDQITPTGFDVLETVAGEMAVRQLMTLSLVGHADRSGSVAYNERLSLRRVESVRQALAARGIPMAVMTVEAQGESQPLVATRDGVREPANRRVEITFR